MNIFLNGETREISSPLTLSGLLEQLRLSGQRLAVERNGGIVPRSEHAQTALAEGDRLEIVKAIGGG